MYNQELTLFNEKGHNRYLFSNYYFKHFLKEMEVWKTTDEASEKALKEIRKLDMPKEGANESQTEDKWIRPILELLGHHYNVNVSINTPLNYKAPDYIFYPDEATRKQEEGVNYKEITLRDKAIAVGEAKSWNRDLDRQLKEETVFEGRISQNPTYQIDFYIRHTELDWGILTNGKIWRLYHKDSSRKLDVYYWIDLEKLIHPDNPSDNFKYFYLFFRRQAFIKSGFLDTVLNGSREHAQNVGEKLNQEVFNALELLMEGFISFPKNKLAPTQENLNLAYDNSLILLYRLLFVLYAESRKLLADRKYKNYYGLKKLNRKVVGNHGEYDLKNKYILWVELKHLWEVLNEGNNEINFKAYNGGLFDPEKHSFLETYRIGDYYLAEVIKKLVYIEDDEKNIQGFIDYSDLDIRHLGSIYEGLLEYKPKKEIDPENGLKIILLNDKGERKVSGSYYTPDYIVKYIVEQAIEPVIEQVVKECRDVQLNVPTNDELNTKLLSIKILDPAMGSGHFLVEATDYLANKLVELGIKPEELAQEEEQDKTKELEYWRRKVVQSCIYGVDLNPLAVELAKVALWLSTVAKEKPLSFLDHHLRCGNSLVGARMIDLKAPKPKAKKEDTEEWLFEKEELDAVAHEAGQAIEKIEQKDIENLQDAKEVENIYENEVRPTLQKYRILADLWTAQYFGLKIDAQIWRSLSDYVLKGVKQLKDAHEYVQKATDISNNRHFFHWELEFPEVFFERENPGFDVVMGNPPYVRQEQLSDNKQFFGEIYTVYTGISDLYVYFFEKGLSMTRADGFFSIIVSNKFLRANYGKALTNYLQRNYRVLELINFGDLPVFAEAATYPCIISLKNERVETDQVIKYVDIETLDFIDLRSEIGENGTKVKLQKTDKHWIIEDAKTRKILEKLNQQNTNLGEYTQNKIYRGILTGYNKAFIIDEETRQELIAKDAKSADIIKPYLSGREIKRYSIDWDGNYIILSKNGIDVPKDYPAIFEHLSQYEKALKKRYDQGEFWYNLRACAYYDEFETPKIVSPDISDKVNFSFDTQNYILGNTAYIFPVDDLWLLSILNSKMINFFYSKISSIIRGGFMRFIRQYLEQIPIPQIDESEQTPFVEKADFMLTKNKELQNLKTEFTDILQSRLNMKKLSKNLQDWNELDWEQFQKELKKKRVKLGLSQEKKWRQFFADEKEKAEKIQQKIDKIDEEIDQMVYNLYELSPEEIETINLTINFL